MPFLSTHTLRTIASTTTRPIRSLRPIPAQARLGGITLPFAALFGSSAAQAQSSKSNSGNEMSGQPKVQKSEGEWQAILSPEQFRVIRQKGTERPGSHPYDHQFKEGVYNCAACDAPLYTSKTKFDSGCGWPAFFDTIPGAVVRHEDRSMFTTRTEIVCANCGGHLGHVFKGEGFGHPTDERHCVNGISLSFKEDEKK
ncbi:Peptide methionine sulfoxide reductase 2 [Saitozyma sp. JCM 24511]|nr:Peptide methionine sulfoxide reductase 2 [Saitozyma sp. JCM 24511]